MGVEGGGKSTSTTGASIGRYGLLTRSVTFLNGKKGGFLVPRLRKPI